MLFPNLAWDRQILFSTLYHFKCLKIILISLWAFSSPTQSILFFIWNFCRPLTLVLSLVGLLSSSASILKAWYPEWHPAFLMLSDHYRVEWGLFAPLLPLLANGSIGSSSFFGSYHVDLHCTYYQWKVYVSHINTIKLYFLLHL